MTSAEARARSDAPASTGRVLLGVLLSGSLLSMFGDGLALVSAPWFILHVSTSGYTLGFSMAIVTGTGAASLLLAGPVADRFDPMLVAILVNVAALACAAAVCVLSVLSLLLLPDMVALLCGIQVAQGPGVGARQHLITQFSSSLRSPDTANTGYWVSQQLGLLLGTSVGGVIQAVGGVTLAFAGDGATFLLAALLTWVACRRHRPPADTEAAATSSTGVKAYVADLAAGFRVLLRSRVLRMIIFGALALNGFDGSLLTVLVPSQVHNHGGSAVSFGLISALYSAGLLVGALAGGVLTRRWPRGRTAAGCVLASAAGYALVALSGVSTLVGVGVIGLASGPLMPIILDVVQQVAPQRMLGRISSALFGVLTISAPVGVAVVGAIIGAVSPAGAAYAGAAVFAAMAAIFFLRRSLLDADQPT